MALGLGGPEAVATAARNIEAAVAGAGHRLEGLIVQPMALSGIELIVGVINHHSFGPVLACGAGGTTAELIKDVAVRITRLTDADARRTTSASRLRGYAAGLEELIAASIGSGPSVAVRSFC